MHSQHRKKIKSKSFKLYLNISLNKAIPYWSSLFRAIIFLGIIIDIDITRDGWDTDTISETIRLISFFFVYV